jgi:ABC-type transport system involved in multi-copper enzyme maturation permease subunit
MMGDIGIVMAAEWLKLRKKRSTVVIPLVVVGLSAAILWGLSLAARRDWIGVPSAFYITSAALGWMVNIIGLFAVIITSFHVSREFALGTVKSTWVRPVPRLAWYTGKVLSAWMMIGALLLLAVMVIIVLAATTFRFADLMEKSFLVHSAASLWGKLSVTVLLVLAALWAVTVVISMIAVFFNHPGGAIGAGVGFGMLLVVLGVFPSTRPFLLTTCITQPVEQMTAMSKGIPLPLPWNTLIWRTLGGAVTWMAAAYCTGAWWIRKKEITF